MNISRRDFLRLMGVTGALAGGYSGAWAVPDEWMEKMISGPKVETWKVSTCGQCPAGCGIRVRLIDDIPVRILGNPIAPVNRGFICPMGEAGLELLYHPDRITQPLRRNGEKGASHFEPISWDEALKYISQSLKDLQKNKEINRFGFLMGDRNTLLTDFAGGFARGLGSPNFYSWRNPGVNELGFWQGYGEYSPFAFDLTRCDYLLTFGTNLLEETPSPVHFNRIYGRMKENRPRSGLKMVHVSPRASQAGINATEWVQIRPGSMGVLALGMVYVILRDKIYDQNFIRYQALDIRNIEDFRTMVNRDYYPDRISQVTGIRPETVIRLAREFGSAKAPIALSGGTSDRGETALFNQWAITCLNAISGSLSVKGLWREPAELPWGPPRQASFDRSTLTFSPEPPKAESAHIPASWVTERLPDYSGEGKVPELKLLMIAQANPVFQATNHKAWQEFLGGISQVIQFATLIDDTSLYADIILPQTTYLEQWDLTLPVPNLPFPQLGLNQPVVTPKKGTRSLGDVLSNMGKALNIPFLRKKPVKSYENFLQSRMREIFSSGKGTPFFEEISMEFLEELRKRGWQVYSYPTFKDFWQLLKEKGGWWDPEEYPDLDGRKRRKFTFPTIPRLSGMLKDRSLEKSDEGGETRDKAPHLWMEESIKKPDNHGTFTLVPFTTLFHISGEGASQPILQELSGMHPRLYWQTWAEMNPERARELSLDDGDLIRVVSENGSFTIPVKVVPTVSSEILSIPIGKGHKESGRYAKNIGVNPFSIVHHGVDPLSGRISWQSTLVRVEKIKT